MRRMTSAMSALWVVVSLTGGVGVAWAQEEAPGLNRGGLSPELGAEVQEVTLGGTLVSLEELLDHAERSAPALAVAQAEVGLADADFGAAAPWLPSNTRLNLGLGPRIAANAGAATDLNAQAQLWQQIEIAGQRPLRFDVARAARATREGSLARAHWLVHQQIHAGYRAALAARRRTELERRLVTFSAQLLDIAQRRVRAGDAAALIERLAEADLAQARQRAVAALQTYRDACLFLAEISGWPVASPPEPVGALTAPHRAPTLAQLTELALEHNPELVLRRAAVREAELREDLASREAFPSPHLGIQYGYEGAPGGGVAEHVVMGRLLFEIPAFAVNQAERARTSAARDVAEARKDAIGAVIEARLERLRSAVDAAAARVESYGSDILPRFEENLTMLRRSFELGEIDLLRVSVALQRFLSIQQQALSAHVDYFSAVAALEAQVGKEISTHVGGAQ